MYRHGPFSFDLKEELSGMRASNIIEFATSTMFKLFLSFEKVANKYKRVIRC